MLFDRLLQVPLPTGELLRALGIVSRGGALTSRRSAMRQGPPQEREALLYRPGSRSRGGHIDGGIGGAGGTEGAALRGRVALVTGAGRNIGRAIVLGFAASGADVVALARASRGEVEAVRDEARALGVRAVACLADVRDAAAVERAVAESRAELGAIDVLVNAAANRPERAFEEIAADEWHEVVSVILDGAYVCTRAVIGGMLEQGRGSIINVVGLSGQAGAARRAHVVTAKAGLIGFTKALALEYAARGITVNAVSPGMIDTDRQSGSSAAAPAHHAGRTVPVGRLGRPDEVASLCCYLASDAARFITGQTLSVNGGAYL